MAAVVSSVTDEQPTQSVIKDVNQETKTESVAPQQADDPNTAATLQSSTTEVASPETNGHSSNRNFRYANKGPRPPLKFDAATEDRVRDLMSKARSVANGGDNAFKSDEDIYDLALLTNNLVQLMNAAYIVSVSRCTA